MPAAPYITAAELRAYLSLAPEDPGDFELEVVIAAASAAIEQFCNRDFGPGVRTEGYFQNFGGRVFYPRVPPVESITSATIDGVEVATRIVEGRRGIIRTDGGFWEGEVQITYSTVDPVPEDVKLAAKMTAQAIWESPALDKNLTGVQVGGLLSGAYDSGGPGFIPRGAQSLIAQRIRHFS